MARKFDSRSSPDKYENCDLLSNYSKLGHQFNTCKAINHDPLSNSYNLDHLYSRLFANRNSIPKMGHSNLTTSNNIINSKSCQNHNSFKSDLSNNYFYNIHKIHLVNKNVSYICASY